MLSGRTFRYIGNKFNHSCPFCGSFFCNQIYFGTYKDFILKPLFHIELFGLCQERTSIFSKEKLTLCQKIIFCCALFIGPESDHWQCLSLTHSLLFSKLIDVTMACEDANSKLVEVVTIADVDAEDDVGYS